ncbi:DUF262 domain-containing protein [Myxococcota bacterium]|nr:DUF262 domain-containing protein [Myxococcota bacterium]
MGNIDTNSLILPNFQREFKWKIEQIQSLIASFLVAIPTGSLLVLQGTRKDFAARPIGRLESINDDSASPCEYLLDGQQRMTALRSALYDLFSNEWLESWDSAYSNVRLRWFLKVNSGDEDSDLFGWNTLSSKGFQDVDPNDLEQYIVFKRIFKNQVSDWWHPAHKPPPDPNLPLRKYLAKEAAKEGLVPLYEVSKRDNGWLKEALSVIGKQRVEKLQEAIEANRDSPLSQGVLRELEKYREPADSVWPSDDAWSGLRADWSANISAALFSVLEQKLPLIVAPTTELPRAVATFEALNRGGTRLDNYDLVVARAARNSHLPNLSERIVSQLESAYRPPKHLNDESTDWSPKYMKVVDNQAPTSEFKKWYLNVLSMCCWAKAGEELLSQHVKSQKILTLSEEQINTNTESVVESIIRSLMFLQFRCGVVHASDLHYKLMLLPIAFCLSFDDVWKSKKALDKIEYWYWVSLFGGGYIKDQNNQCVTDTNDLLGWIKKDLKNPFSTLETEVLKRKYYSDKTILLRDKYEGADKVDDIPKAVVLGFNQFVLSRSPRDFIGNQNEHKKIKPWQIAKNNDEKIEIHHVYPLASVTNIGESTSELRKDAANILNSPLNKTPILSNSNRIIGSYDLGRYKNLLTANVLIDHLLPNDGHELLLSSSEHRYREFLVARYNTFSARLIEHLDDLKS